MSKVLIGVGAGCGAVIFVGVIVLVAGGMWAKGKIDETAQSGDKMQGLEQRVTSLSQRYAFSEPPKGQPLALSEGRLQDYLRIRMALKPVLDDFEVKARQFAPQKGEQVGLTKSLQAIGMMNELRADLSAKWMEELERQKMSPREFHAITATVYTSAWSKTKGDAGTGKKLAAGTAPSGYPRTFAANAALVEKYKKRIADATSAGLDMFLVGNSDEMGTAFQDVLDRAANSPDPAPVP